MEIYLDNSATTRPYDEVTDLVADVMRNSYGNPSSLHDRGFDAEKLVTRARRQVAEAMGCREDEIYFTSGGTESDNTAVLCGAYARRRQGNKVITSCIEHPAVLEPMKRLEKEGFDVVYLPVDSRGVVDMGAFRNAMDDDVILISIMQVNNELGAVQPIEKIAELKGNALLHADMVQGFGKLKLPLTGVDMASISGHKIGGPKGIGALYIKKGVHIEPFMAGGGQERGLRSGTENVPGICGLGLACELSFKDREKKNEHLSRLRDEMVKIFKEGCDDVIINSYRDAAPHILSVTFPKTRGEVILHAVEQEGIMISTGSACSANKNDLSHVIRAIGHDDEKVKATLRFSFCDSNTMQEVQTAAEKTIEAVNRFKALKTGTKWR